MKNTLLLLSLIFLCHSLQAQSYLVRYSHIVAFDALTTRSEYDLFLSREVAIYYQAKRQLEANTTDEVKQMNMDVVPFVKKDYRTKTMHCNQPITNKIFFIEDKLPLQKWTLLEETRTITQFTCKKASTTFRGRTYTAWYTTEIPIIGGPWKFDGLPGLILQVSSDDGVLSIEAVRIEKKETVETPALSYNKSELITWEEYCADYRKAIDRIKKSMQANAEPDVELSLNLKLVEDIGL